MRAVIFLRLKTNTENRSCLTKKAPFLLLALWTQPQNEKTTMKLVVERCQKSTPRCKQWKTEFLLATKKSFSFSSFKKGSKKSSKWIRLRTPFFFSRLASVAQFSKQLASRKKFFTANPKNYSRWGTRTPLTNENFQLIAQDKFLNLLQKRFFH